MSRFLLAIVLLAALAPGIADACSNLLLRSVAVNGMRSDGKLNYYQINGIVQNTSDVDQPSRVGQALDIYQGQVKVDSKFIQPLKTHHSFRFQYIAQRSSDAAAGTTQLHFVLDAKKPPMCTTPAPVIVTF